MGDFRSVSAFSGDITSKTDDVYLQYDDSFDGFLTAVFESYKTRPLPKSIVGSQFQHNFMTQIIYIETDLDKARRVASGIRKTMGEEAYSMVYVAFISETVGKEDIIYKFIRLGMKNGPSIVNQLALPEVVEMTELAKRVGREKSKMIEFIRFSKSTEGIYYSKIEPSCNITPLVMPFFVDRFRTMPFIIHDPLRKVAGISDMKKWAMVDASGFIPPEFSEDERYIKNLWKCFYDTVAVKERINHKLRTQHMPQKYWKNITELTMVREDLDYSHWMENKASNRIDSGSSKLNQSDYPPTKNA